MVEILLAVTLVCVAALAMYVSSLIHQISRHESHIRELERRIDLLHKQILKVEGCNYLKGEGGDS